MDGTDPALSIALPERFDRRLRFGPFPSARDGLKFVLYAAAGGVLAPFASPLLWLPIVALGFVLSVAKPDGEAVDERALAFVLWRLRRRRSGAPVTEPPDGPGPRRGLLRRPGTGHYAVLRVGGAPLAYLPPSDLEHRFELYRELLRGIDGSFAWTARTDAIPPGPVSPAAPLAAGADATAGAGYSELVQKLLSQRRARRVEVLLASTEGRASGVADLERRVARLAEGLTAMGLRPIRLVGRPLRQAGRGLGLRSEGRSP